MDCRDIIREYIMQSDYDGLCNLDVECGCGLDDFMPCGEDCMDCEPAYIHPDGGYSPHKPE